MQVNINNLIDNRQCYAMVRQLRWSEGTLCPFCNSKRVIKRGFDDKEPARQRHECKDCGKRFDDLTGTIFAMHHQPLKTGRRNRLKSAPGEAHWKKRSHRYSG